MMSKKRFLAWFWGTTACYAVLVTAGSLIRKSIGSGPSPEMWAIAGGSIAAALGLMALIITRGRKEKELERFLFTESTSLAFFVTMIFAVTYGLLESWVELPRLTAWATWSVGMFSWGLLSTALKRRVS
jgi:hypothetical protein